MTVKYHPERRQEQLRQIVQMLASPQRVIPNEVRDLAYEVHVPMDRQRNRSSCERSLAALGMTLLVAAKQMSTKNFRARLTKTLEFSIEPFNVALSEPGRRPDLSWQKNFDRLNKCSN